MKAALGRAFGFGRWLVRLEIGIWRSLLLWGTRRKPGQRPSVQAFAYSRDVVPLMTAFIFASTLELVVVHLLLPWETIRLAADILSIWGLLWMLGYLASVKVFPHLISDDELRVRSGTTADIRMPWAAVASVTAQRRSVPTRKTVSVERDHDRVVASVAVLKQTKVDVVFHQPTTLTLPDGPQELTELRLYVDKPGTFVAAARQSLTDRPTVELTASRG